MKRDVARTVTGMLGVTAMALLHSLFFASALRGSDTVSRFPDQPVAIGAGANLGTIEGESLERRMFIRLMTPDVDVTTPTAAPMARLIEEALAPRALDITGPDSLPLPPLISEDEGDPAESSDAELMARVKMVGIYESQIRARIERAWTLPEYAPTKSIFTCRALIRQRPDGRITEVELPYDSCEGSPEMRQSLVNAIFTASPLPAPPHPGVFADTFLLVFRSQSVSQQGP